MKPERESPAWKILLGLYAQGDFVMAKSRHGDEVDVVTPRVRGVIPIRGFRIPRRLARTLRSPDYEIRLNRNPLGVLEECAAARATHDGTWINDWIIDQCMELRAHGALHSVECYRGEDLVGGLYGIELGGAFFGESMFSRATDASKICLVHLVSRLLRGGFTLLDAQFPNRHLDQFGAISMPQARYLDLLDAALPLKTRFLDVEELYADQLLQSITQTS
jgi:leucyl/phenylalanyl-tRNA---protein transferase